MLALDTNSKQPIEGGGGGGEAVFFLKYSILWTIARNWTLIYTYMGFFPKILDFASTCKHCSYCIRLAVPILFIAWFQLERKIDNT